MEPVTEGTYDWTRHSYSVEFVKDGTYLQRCARGFSYIKHALSTANSTWYPTYLSHLKPIQLMLAVNNRVINQMFTTYLPTKTLLNFIVWRETFSKFYKIWNKNEGSPNLKVQNRITPTNLLQRKSSVAIIPQANYTDWTTLTYRRNIVPTFADRGVSRDQRGESPTAVNLSFRDQSRYF
jgi:hypothetical protein